MYWSLMTLTTIGERPPPETDLVSQPFIAIFDIFSKYNYKNDILCFKT